MISPETQLKELQTGADEIISPTELLKKLQRSYAQQKPLCVKLGADPSRPDIHLGHVVVLNKLRLLQEFGHKVKFIVGDFTAMIGDPSGKSKTRPQLSKEEIEANARTYREQAFKILDREKTDIVYNSTWLNQLSPSDFIRILATRTLQQIIARDDFSKRYQQQSPIHLHELIYPVMQGYDSVILQSDIELGGTDQKFNLLVGREMQRQNGQEPQCLILCPLLEGLDGVRKMSKSLDNYISITDRPEDMFGKTMSVSDPHMLKFYELLSRKGRKTVEALKQGLKNGFIHPMLAKKDLAEEIVSHYWGDEAATKARENFDRLFSKKDVPEELLEHRVSASKDGTINLLEISVETGFSKSKSEARRILRQNGIKIDAKPVQNESLTCSSGDSFVFRQGKLKIIRLIIL